MNVLASVASISVPQTQVKACMTYLSDSPANDLLIVPSAVLVIANCLLHTATTGYIDDAHVARVSQAVARLHTICDRHLAFGEVQPVLNALDTAMQGPVLIVMPSPVVMPVPVVAD